MTERAIMITDDRGKDIMVGAVLQGVLHMRRAESTHLFRASDSWGIDSLVAENVQDVHTFEIYDYERHKTYRVKRDKFIEKSKHLHFEGHRLQRFLPRIEWEVVEDEH